MLWPVQPAGHDESIGFPVEIIQKHFHVDILVRDKLIIVLVPDCLFCIDAGRMQCIAGWFESVKQNPRRH